MYYLLFIVSVYMVSLSFKALYSLFVGFVSQRKTCVSDEPQCKMCLLIKGENITFLVFVALLLYSVILEKRQISFFGR